MISLSLLSYFYHTYNKIPILKRDKNIKITSKTHETLKEYCEKNGLKMFSFVEKLIREKCVDTVKTRKDFYQEE